MSECPKCKHMNNEGAKFCTKCGTKLEEPQARPTKRLDTIPAATIPLPEVTVDPSRHGTRPLPPLPVLEPRPDGAIFGDRFVSTRLLFSDNQAQFCYQVREIGVDQKYLIRQCPSCGAVHSKWEEGFEPDQFCSSCGTQMEATVVDLQLFESTQPSSASIAQIAAMGLVHANIRAPLAAFNENIGGVTRYCVVTPPVEAIPQPMEQNQALRWVIGLARAIDYLYRNHVTFNGQIDPAFIGFSGNRLVWSNFQNSFILDNDSLEQGRLNDLKGLVFLLYQWLTGKTAIEADPNLPDPINAMVKQAFGPQGFRTGKELANTLEAIVNDVLTAIPIDLHVGKLTNVGMVRNLNEDSMFSVAMLRTVQSRPQSLGVFVVADGMGGHSAGEVASGAIVNYFSQRAPADLASTKALTGGMDWSEWLKDAVNGANKAVYDMRKQAGTDMGSTLVMAVMDGLKVFFAHVGDSRGYVLDRQGIHRITPDHSLVERLIATGQIRREEARVHPQRNVIYRTIGDKSMVEVDVNMVTLEPGNKILLCSDGLWEMVEDDYIYKCVQESVSPMAACEKLIAAANAAGGDDNITVIIVEAAQVG
jgi:protein phosphatase